MTVEEFIEALKQHGITLSDKQIQQFDQYYTLLVEWNERMNLTAITDRESVYLKHFYDSLMPLWTVPSHILEGELCDVGAGAGFPSIPMKIVRPELKVTIVDSLQKRLTFIAELANTLELTDVLCVHGRAEEVGQSPLYREQFDVVTARAVAALNVLSEYCLPLAKVGGNFIALKGQKADDELLSADKAIRLLGGTVEQSWTEALPHEESERTIIWIHKENSTPKKYPRRPGIPTKQPIH